MGAPVKPVLRIGPVRVHSYKVMLYAGCVAGVYAGAAIGGRYGMDEDRFALMTCALLVPAFAGARLWYAVQRRALFRAQRGRVLRRSDGGAALYGGLIAGPLVSVPVLAAAGLPFWTFWDATAVTMLVGLAFTRVGCLLHGCCGGRLTGRRLLTRYPTQLLEVALAMAVLVVALLVHQRLGPGMLISAVVVSYSAGRALLQPLRADASPAGAWMGQAARRAVGASWRSSSTASSTGPWVESCP